MDKQTVLEVVQVGLALILKTVIKQAWEQFKEVKTFEKFLVWATRGAYHKKKRENDFHDLQIAHQKEEETKRQLEYSVRVGAIEDLLAEIRIRNDFHRVTLSKLFFTGEGIFPESPTLQDFKKVNVTIICESVSRGIAKISHDWQNRSGKLYAPIFYSLYYDPNGYIIIGPNDSDNLTTLMNMNHVVWSIRFKMSRESSIFDGMITCSVMFGDMPDESKIKTIAKEVGNLASMTQEILINM